MPTKKTLQQFNVAAKIELEVNVTIDAVDFYDAIEKIKFLTLDDYVTVNGDLNDSEIKGISYIGSANVDGFKLK